MKEQVRRAFKRCIFLSPKRHNPPIQASTPTSNSSHPLFCCPFFFNPQVRINKMVNKYSVHYHPSPSRLTSRIHPLIEPIKGYKKDFMAPFYGWGSTASRLQPLRGGSLLFTIQFPEILGTHFIDLVRTKGWVDLGATQWIWARDPWIGNPAP